MQELITEGQAQEIVLALCAIIFFGSPAFGFFWKSRIAKPQRRLFFAQTALAALVGPLLAGLWFVYNAIEDHYGLDSVKALEINAFIFLLTAFLLGYLFFWALPARFSKTR